MELKLTGAGSRTAEGLIGEMERTQGRGCADCGAILCSHQVLMNMAVGFRDNPRCLPCLAAGLSRNVEQLRDYLIAYLQQRECYETAWAWADRSEGTASGGIRACLSFPASESRHDGISLYEDMESMQESGGLVSPPDSTVEWDAGDMGCGDLVLELRLRLQAMKSGEIMKLSARDPGAREDLPAWCRLTGHRLLRAEHPTYWIQRKE